MISKEAFYRFDVLQKYKKRQILRNILYYNCFLKSVKFTKELADNNKSKKTTEAIGRIVYKDFEEKIFFKKKSTKILMIFNIQGAKEISTYDFLCELEFITDNIFRQFLYPLPNSSRAETIFFEWQYDNDDLYKNFIKKNRIHRFILGTGLSIDYGAKKWKDLINDMKNSINSINPYLDADKLKEDFFGNMYGIPQILKDLNKNFYYDTLYKSIYDGRTFFSNPNYNLNKIARYIDRCYHRNDDNIEIITFNYDDFLEEELKILKIDFGSVFSYNKISYNAVKINHIHGFLPKECKICNGNYRSQNINSIILTDDEYNGAYSEPRKYTYEKLLNFLNKTSLIVGNSISDYEERKVFRVSKNKENPFHFALRVKENNFNDLYISSFLMNIGVIVVFFNSYAEIGSFIEEL